MYRACLPLPSIVHGVVYIMWLRFYWGCCVYTCLPLSSTPCRDVCMDWPFDYWSPTQREMACIYLHSCIFLFNHFMCGSVCPLVLFSLTVLLLISWQHVIIYVVFFLKRPQSFVCFYIYYLITEFTLLFIWSLTAELHEHWYQIVTGCPEMKWTSKKWEILESTQRAISMVYHALLCVGGPSQGSAFSPATVQTWQTLAFRVWWVGPSCRKVLSWHLKVMILIIITLKGTILDVYDLLSVQGADCSMHAHMQRCNLRIAQNTG